MLQVLLIAFATYILYNFIFRFVIPLVRVTRQVKRQVRDFNQQAANMQGGFTQGSFHGSAGPFGQQGPFGNGGPFGNSGPFQQHRQAQPENFGQTTIKTGSVPNDPSSSSPGNSSKTPKDDYIDFEEIK